MTVQPEVVRQGDLLNRLVLNHDTMEELGRIEVLWMYPQAHRVLGFVCKAGLLGNRKLAFKLSQIEAIGSNGILTHSQPDATDADRVRQLESLIHCEVWSQAGTKLGRIIDCEFNLRSGVITDYLLTGDRLSGLAGTIHRLPPTQIASFGRTRVLVAATSLQTFAIYREGIGQKLAKVTSTLKEEYDQVTEELKILAKQAQETTQQTTAQFKTLAEQAREQAWEQAQRLAEQAKEKVQELNEQLNEQLNEPLDEPLDKPLDEPLDELLNRQGRDKAESQGVSTAEDDDLLDEIHAFGRDHDDGDESWISAEQPPTRTDDVRVRTQIKEWQTAAADGGEDLWELEDDPWDITEPPIAETVVPIRTNLDGDPESWFEPEPAQQPATSPAIATELSHPEPSSPKLPNPNASEPIVSKPKLSDPKVSDPKASTPETPDDDDEPWI